MQPRFQQQAISTPLSNTMLCKKLGALKPQGSLASNIQVKSAIIARLLKTLRP